MKFRKFVAASTRDCLRMMREALGADAMIVSTRRTTAGVEVVGIRAQDMPNTGDDGQADPPAAGPETPAASVSSPALWDDMEDESVRLSPAARVLAQHGDEASRAEAPPLSPLPQPPGRTDLPRAQWPRLEQDDIRHLVRGERDFADPAHAMAVAAAEGVSGKPVLRLGLVRPEAEKRRRAPAGRAAPGGAPGGPPAPPAARIDERDRDALAHRVSEPIVSEMRSMRDWLAHQMDAMAWRDSTQRDPRRRELWRRMVDSGFTPELARTVAARLPASQPDTQVDRWLAEVLAGNLACVGAEAGVIEQGGRYAVVGPTGVGKTTTTAKIAAHCVVKYGAGALGLISTDQNRIGAVDQLHTFGRILGVEVYAARGVSDLEVLLASMADRRLVLIDTAGMSQRDTQMGQHLQAIAAEGVQRLLVVPGGTHAEQADDIVRAYSAGGLAGMIVSKLDEAVRLGGVLDAAIRHRLPLHYMTNGQRVPEDIHAANARLLVHRALRARHAPVFALDAEELEWACSAPPAPGAQAVPSQPAQA
ncbi:MAG: flagellar biosynthesis protein FlhF [Pigmentiphaga sp.]|uniref:flagellar biosynthesis protein FlhF n=1 Tax=Pigmentiphaga sp. TaxID=1977564 RepID=UPI0029BF5090|nr:flagellar biosynthesis protein FlhF [Pigmentiphaga sp.]MDX3904119.1 flagellar biosynthesis protein FlhF [Pigmentiphaga sp.]